VTIHEHHLTVARTARYFTLGEPGPEAEDVWFVCHGYGQLAKHFIRHFEPIASPRRLIVAPEALSRFYLESPNTPAKDRRVGATWMTREDRLAEIEDQIAYLDALLAQTLGELSGPEPRVRVLGFSQGVATVMRWIVHGSARPHDLVLWAGSVPPELELGAHQARLAAVRLALVVGTHDEYASWAALDEQRARFESHGLPARALTFDGGHHLDADLLARLADEPA